MMNGDVMPKSVPPKIGPASLILAENFAKFGPPGHFAGCQNQSTIHQLYVL